MQKELNDICSLYAKYLSDPTYVYTTHPLNSTFIIVYQKTKNTITNENRSNIYDTQFALYRADRLVMRLVINKLNPTIFYDYIDKNGVVSNRGYGIDIIYPQFDMNLDKCTGNGIYFYKTIYPAFYDGLYTDQLNYSGKYVEWDVDGKLSYVCILQFGKQIYENDIQKISKDMKLLDI